MVNHEGLSNAARVLDDMAAGHKPNLTQLMSGLHALRFVELNADLAEATQTLETLLTNGIPKWDAFERARLAQLADCIRALAAQFSGARFRAR